MIEPKTRGHADAVASLTGLSTHQVADVVARMEGLAAVALDLRTVEHLGEYARRNLGEAVARQADDMATSLRDDLPGHVENFLVTADQGALDRLGEEVAELRRTADRLAALSDAQAAALLLYVYGWQARGSMAT